MANEPWLDFQGNDFSESDITSNTTEISSPEEPTSAPWLDFQNVDLDEFRGEKSQRIADIDSPVFGMDKQQLGFISEQFESRGRPDAISSGVGSRW